MKQNSRFITLAGGILAFFSFVLPWESDYSGIYLANGRGNFTTILLIVAFAFVITSIYLIYRKPDVNPWFIKFPLIIIAVIGIYTCIVTISEAHSRGINFVLLAFVASLVVISASIFMLNRQVPWRSLSTLWILINCIIGLCCYFILFIGESLGIELNDVHIDNVRYGASLTAVGFILAIVGSLCFPITGKSTETDNQ